MAILSVTLIAILILYAIFRIVKFVRTSKENKITIDNIQNATEDVANVAKVVAPFGGYLAWLSAPNLIGWGLIKIGLIAVPLSYVIGKMLAAIAAILGVLYLLIKLYKNRHRV